MNSGNLYKAIPTALPQEIVACLVSAGGVTIERIVSKGHCSPPDFWYDQAQSEWVLVVSGEARLEFEAKTLHLRPGDYVNIPAHVRHRVAWTQPEVETIWLAVFY